MIRNFNKYWNYTKYQMFTKFITGIFFLPIFYFLRDFLIKSTGRTGINSGDYLGFLLSPQGILLALISFVFFVIMIGIDLNAFIVMSYLLEENYKLKMRDMFKIALKSSRKFLNPMGVIVVLYIGLIMPILGLGFSIGPLAKFEIPNFIMSVIENTPLYYAIYITAIFVLTVILILGIFSIHYMLLFDGSIKESFKFSVKLIKKNWKNFVKTFIVFNIKFFLVFLAIFLLFLLLIFLPVSTLELGDFVEKTYLFFVLIVFSSISAFIIFIAIPLQVEVLSKLFGKYIEKEGNQIPNIEDKFNLKDLEKSKYRFKFKFIMATAIAIILAINLGFSMLMSAFFDEIFKRQKDVKIVAHRAGGDFSAENSIKGLELAIENNVSFSEIDVQRTKDGYYVINHDKNFARLTGEKRTSSELTLDEVEKLMIKDEFDSSREPQKVATLEEMLNTSKGNIGLFIELKGTTADEKMVDDVVKMVKDKNMEKEVAILSLDYKLIKYTESKYPEMDTGFLYFFSFGDVKKIVGDFLIMEEKEATDENIEDIHSVGKKAIVWTVNTNESINKFIEKDVDGIITDHVKRVQDAIKNRENRSDLDIIFDTILGN